MYMVSILNWQMKLTGRIVTEVGREQFDHRLYHSKTGERIAHEWAEVSRRSRNDDTITDPDRSLLESETPKTQHPNTTVSQHWDDNMIK